MSLVKHGKIQILAMASTFKAYVHFQPNISHILTGAVANRSAVVLITSHVVIMLLFCVVTEVTLQYVPQDIQKLLESTRNN